MQAGLSQSPTELRSAFETFNHLSVQLAHSYEVLERQVSALTRELDVVSQQRLQELQEKELVANRLETLISLLPGGVVVLDHKGDIVDINPTAENLLEKDLKGQCWRHVINRCFAPKDDDGHEVSNHQGKRINITTRSLGQDGQIILLTDQTETRRLQAELSRHERLTALGKMVSTLAHQVRTPLSSAMLYGGHLLDRQLPDHQRQQFTQKLVNRLHDMERQVNDMLLFVRSDIALQDHLSLNDFQNLLQESMEMILQQYQASVNWSVSAHHCVLNCNKLALINAVLNLVTNSMQAASTSPVIDISLQQKTPNILLISIKDNGAGVASTNKERIEELFFTTKPQGTGIGLTVVKTVVKAHGGTFSLNSQTQGGMVAAMELPIISPANQPMVRE